MLLIVLMLAILTYFFGTEYRSLEMDYDRNDSLGGPSLIPHSEYRITYILTKRMCTLILTHAMQCNAMQVSLLKHCFRISSIARTVSCCRHWLSAVFLFFPPLRQNFISLPDMSNSVVLFLRWYFVTSSRPLRYAWLNHGWGNWASDSFMDQSSSNSIEFWLNFRQERLTGSVSGTKTCSSIFQP